MYVTLLVLCGAVWAEGAFYAPHRTVQTTGDPGQPLFLTPYLERGEEEAGREAARVRGMPVDSYAGLFTVNKTHLSHMFFWYFPSERNPQEAPVVVWLQGGPGASSTMGLFQENGPLMLEGGTLKKRDVGNWNGETNLVYFDSPVGTGFSTTSEEGYARTEEDVGRDLREALIQFLDLFPVPKRLFIAGESYAGKYVPALAMAVLDRPGVILEGIAVGNGYSAPDLMLDYGEYLYQIGLLDASGRKEFEDKQEAARGRILAEDWNGAYVELKDLVVGGGLFRRLTGFRYHYNILHEEDPAPFIDVDLYLQSASVRRMIHVGDLEFHAGDIVEEKLREDFPRSVKPWLETLLGKTRVLFYSGQLDIVVAYPLTENLLANLVWDGAREYLTTSRKPWKVADRLAGYSRTVRNLTEVLVRNAGHLVPMDQPLWALDMFTRFIHNKPF